MSDGQKFVIMPDSDILAYLETDTEPVENDGTDPLSKIEVREFENEIIVDCRGLAALDDVPRVEVEGEESVSLETVPPVEEVPVDSVRTCEYSVVDSDVLNRFSPEQIRRFRRLGYFPSFPVAYELSNGEHELIDGIPRGRIAQAVGLDSMTLQVIDGGLWEATKHWAKAYFPHPKDEDPETAGYYSPEEQEEALEILLDDWSEDELRRIPELDHALDRPDVQAPNAE